MTIGEVQGTLYGLSKNGHFKHSQLAYSKLKEIQTTLGMPNHRLIQDVATRWNSSLYMQQSIVSQKVSLAAYSTENDSIPQLTSHQLDMIEKMITILKPIEDITQSFSSDNASASIVIPFVRSLRKSFEDCTDDRGVQTMKHEMLASLNRRFSDIETKEVLVLSTLLDPLLRTNFSVVLYVEREAAKRLLIEKLEEVVSQTDNNAKQRSLEPQEKYPQTAVMKCFDEILEVSST